jgi:DNA-binding CsgD family transcriptional regulator
MTRSLPCPEDAMSRSARLRIEDIRILYRLVGECRELGDDPILWRRHLFAGLAARTGAGIVLGAEIVGVRTGGVAHIGTAEWGWENGFDRAGWDRAMAEMTADPSLSRTPALAAYFARMTADDGASLSRADLLPDGDWYRSWDYENLHRAAGVDHALWCFGSIPGGNDEANGVIAAREHGEPDFTPRQKAIIREGCALLAPLVGGPLARFAEPSPSALSPRARQVLRCLLEGDSDKQVARRLRVSGHTVNEYTKQIYRHFGVQSRAELLARWVRRSWGARCAWIDEQE